MVKLRPILYFVILLYVRTVLSHECGVPQVVNKLVVNAFNTRPGQWPWHVAIHRISKGTEEYACGGTLVTNLHVLTAVHCVQDDYSELLSINDIFVRLGVYELNSTRTDIQCHNIEMIHTIKNSPIENLRNDITILQLATEAKFGEYVQPACVSLTENLIGLNGTVVGWGFDESDRVSPILKSAKFPVVDFYTCLKSDRVTFGRILDEGIFCAGYTNGTAVCNGDSGGGIFFKENNAWHLGGIVSLSIMRDDTDHRCYIYGYAAYTKIHTYLTWIESVTKLPLSKLNTKKCRQLANCKKAFYLEVDIPNSIQRGKVTLIQGLVSNLLKHAISAEVTLFNIYGEFDFVENSSANTTQNTKTVVVPPDSVKPVTFVINAKKLGAVAIKIEANINQSQSDAIERMLHVTPESLHYEEVIERFLVLDYNQTNTYQLMVEIPPSVDKDSVLIKFTLDPNILGQPIKNLEDFIREPSGDGEQNMVNFVQNIFILDYLSETTDVTEQVKTKAIHHIKTGYENQLKYQRSDGSFSAWGSRDSKGSTFLTAFVVTVLKTAAKYITVDNNVVIEALTWLASVQQTDGQFDEKGYVVNKYLQGGVPSSNIALTAFVLIAFIEHEDIAMQYRPVVKRAMNFLAMNISNISSFYDLAITSYGMALGKHPDQLKFFFELDSLMKFDRNGNISNCNRAPFNVEGAGYAILLNIALNNHFGSIRIMRWLNQQGYGHTTQDKFVSLKALTKMALKMSARKNDYRVTITHNVNKTNWRELDIPEFETRYLYVNKTNSKQIQEQNIPDYVQYLNVEVSGIGHGLFKINYQYDWRIANRRHGFAFRVNILNTSSYQIQHLNVCVTFIQKLRDERSNMVQVEVFASGMIVNPNSVRNLSAKLQIIRTESTFGGTSIVVYYNNLGRASVCFEVTASRKHKATLEVPSYVVVYDLSNRDWFAITEF